MKDFKKYMLEHSLILKALKLNNEIYMWNYEELKEELKVNEIYVELCRMKRRA